MRLGRRIYDNLRKAMAFIFAVHVPIAGLALLETCKPLVRKAIARSGGGGGSPSRILAVHPVTLADQAQSRPPVPARRAARQTLSQ